MAENKYWLAAAAAFLITLIAVPGSSAQIQMPNIGRTIGSPTEAPRHAQAPKNLLTLEELNTLDAKFHKEMDVAQEFFDREKFADAQKGFADVAAEIDDTLKRIAVSTLPKNGTMEIDGVKKPATVQNETEWFGRTRDKVKRKQDQSGILANVTDLQKQAQDLLIAGKYPDDLQMYQRAADALAANHAQLDDEAFQFFAARSENGLKQASTAYWAKEFRRLQDKYNKTTEGNMAPDEVRKTIQSVADEIVSQNYLDPAKYPRMPDDARGLIRQLLDAAKQYLGAQ